MPLESIRRLILGDCHSRSICSFAAVLLFVTLSTTMVFSQTKARREAHGITPATDLNGRGQHLPNVLVPTPAGKLIVIGFMGGNVHAANTVHRESSVIGSLKERFPNTVEAQIYANRDGALALKSIVAQLDKDRDGHLNTVEKSSARIIIFGHSWGASQTVTLADDLNRLGVPVLLTIQVDSVQKIAQNDGIIPPNVREAINFYQTEGMLRGRRAIAAADPSKTKILGNFESSYRENPISVSGYPWYARAFMKQHIQIESDPQVWDQVEALIEARIP